MRMLGSADCVCVTDSNPIIVQEAQLDASPTSGHLLMLKQQNDPPEDLFMTIIFYQIEI